MAIDVSSLYYDNPDIVINFKNSSDSCITVPHMHKEACFLSGFRDYSNFRRTFKNYEGYNPGNLEELTSPI